MKKIGLILLLLVMAGGVYVAYQHYVPSNEQAAFNPENKPLVYSEGRLVELDEPYIESGSHLLLSMQLSEMITSAHYYWDQEEQTLVVTTYDHVYRFQPGRDFFMENGRPVDLFVPMQLMNGTPYIPKQFLEQMLSVHASFQPEYHVLIIEENPRLQAIC
jgi:hypothetical protein